MKEVTERRRQEGIRLSTPMPNRVDRTESEKVAVREDTAYPGRVESQADTAEKARVPVQSLTARTMVQGRRDTVLLCTSLEYLSSCLMLV